jgi:hypothetical protein
MTERNLYQLTGNIQDINTLLVQRAELAALRHQHQETLEALRDLVDEQNGPPLLRYAASWQDAMKKSRAAIEHALGKQP